MRTKTWLVASTTIIVIIAVSTLLNTPSKVPKKNIITQNRINSSTSAHKETHKPPENKAPESGNEFKRSDPDKSSRNLSEKSRFNDRCLNILNNADQNIDSSNISENEQRKMAGIFDNCIYEIDMELALIERQIDHTAENAACLNRAYEIRDYLLELGTSAQQFTDMPNYTDSDRVQIAESYSQVLNDIIANGQSAMEIRETICIKTNQ